MPRVGRLDIQDRIPAQELKMGDSLLAAARDTPRLIRRERR
jgi:hypothetical protein